MEPREACELREESLSVVFKGRAQVQRASSAPGAGIAEE
jgi:hypothetical protein